MEILDVVDEYGNPTGERVEREKAHALGIRHRTSHVWVVRNRNNRPEILLQKRCAAKDSFPGCYDISSAGHIPAGCGFKESAVRELSEELGVSVSEDMLIPCGDITIEYDGVFHGRPFHDRQVSRVFIIYIDKEANDFTLQKDEIDSVIWMDLDECITAVENGTIDNCISLEELRMVEAASRLGSR